MRNIIVVGPGMIDHVDDNYIKAGLKLTDEEYKHNSYPAKEGIAIFDCGKAIDLKWADTLPIVIGECGALGDRQQVTHVNPDTASTEIVDLISTLEESAPPEEESGVAE